MVLVTRGVRRHGFILIVALVGLMVLLILGVLSVQLATDSLRQATRERDRVEALASAEAAFYLGEAYLRTFTIPPTTLTRYPTTGTKSFGTTGTGYTEISRQTNPHSPWVSYYMIVGYGTSSRSGRTAKVIGQLAPESFSLFGYFEDTGLSNNWWVGGLSRFDGPFHTNGKLQIDWIKNATASQKIFMGPTSSVSSTVTYGSAGTPGTNDWVSIFAGGRSALTLAADTIPFPTTADAQKAAAWGDTSGYPDETIPANAGVQMRNNPPDGGLYVVPGKDPDDPDWVKSTSYSTGARVSPAKSNGFTYLCTTAGTSSSTIEPVWPTTLGGTVTDNSSVVWKAVAPLTTTASWAGNTTYTVGTRIWPTTPNGHTYVCTTGGKSGASAPTWTRTIGGTVTDGTAVWQETANTPAWQGSKAFVKGDKIRPTAGGTYFVCTTAGTTGSSEPASWPAAGSGTSKTDGTVTWKESTRVLNPDIVFSDGGNGKQVISVTNSVYDSTNKDWYPATTQMVVDLPYNQTTKKVTYRGDPQPTGTVSSGVPAGILYCTGCDVANLSGVLVDSYLENNVIKRANTWTVSTDFSTTGQHNININDNLTYVHQPNASLSMTDPANLRVPAFGTVGYQTTLYNPTLARVSSRAYILGDRMTPSTTNGYYYLCTQAGTTASSSPTLSTTAGAVVTDGTLRWTVVKDDLTINGVLMSTSPSSSGSLRVSDLDSGRQKLRGQLYILGGTIVKTAAILGQYNTSTKTMTYGYLEHYSYDVRMAEGPLTAFPGTNMFDIVSWQCFN
jgi:hypothetical protein